MCDTSWMEWGTLILRFGTVVGTIGVCYFALHQILRKKRRFDINKLIVNEYEGNYPYLKLEIENLVDLPFKLRYARLILGSYYGSVYNEIDSEITGQFAVKKIDFFEIEGYEKYEIVFPLLRRVPQVTVNKVDHVFIKITTTYGDRKIKLKGSLLNKVTQLITK